ncbi:MAG TPA: dephospho-CoA kinase [Candidatus Limnocylindrales bacterium]|nr:dephospho-CoA kinase [Candidatus Limnocylindrales bacterium]
MKTVRIGLTGPIGCGKSTVAGWLEELGAVIIDADDVAREVVEPGTPGFEHVVAAFGRDLVTADGSLDRAALGRIVFADPAALRRLESIVHPAVRPKILDRVLAAERTMAPAVVVEAIKLVEGGLGTMCDEVWLIACDEPAQLVRLAGRGLDEATARARIAAQQDPATRLRPAATRVIETSGDIEATKVAVADAWVAALRAHAGA